MVSSTLTEMMNKATVYLYLQGREREAKWAERFRSTGEGNCNTILPANFSPYLPLQFCTKCMTIMRFLIFQEQIRSV